MNTAIICWTSYTVFMIYLVHQKELDDDAAKGAAALVLIGVGGMIVSTIARMQQ